jgi:hypothetical protein
MTRRARETGFRPIAASIVYAEEGRVLTEEQSRLQGAKLRASAAEAQRQIAKDTAPSVFFVM